MTSSIYINQTVSIPKKEIYFTFSCSRGPGGQHVNKVNTRVTLWFDIANSESLSAQQKSILTQKLTSRVNKNGMLRVVAYKSRSQNTNRTAAVEKFQDLIQSALTRKKHRTQTHIPKKEKLKRLSSKKFRSRLKESRGKSDED